jgi:hypothetical protein
MKEVYETILKIRTYMCSFTIKNILDEKVSKKIDHSSDEIIKDICFCYLGIPN